ncbi:hypothetical protein [Nonomuraea insulae]|uniref:hypothetical protein n=1 Tax=Nonomuraea insulae TaxID=1616787 RepID=UPI0036D3A88D
MPYAMQKAEEIRARGYPPGFPLKDLGLLADERVSEQSPRPPRRGGWLAVEDAGSRRSALCRGSARTLP